ncbi:MAG: hypothetical protein AB7F64_09120 [Gammaproteobacteria bacterium]
MASPINSKKAKEVKMPVLIEPLISILHNIQSKIDFATGAATALELRLRIIAQLDDRVQKELKRKTKKAYHKAELEHLIDSVLIVFQNELEIHEKDIISNCRIPRNKTTHASFAELMITLVGYASSRQLDNHSLKPLPLNEDDIVEGAVCIERNGGLDEFAKRARIAVSILETKVMRTLKP